MLHSLPALLDDLERKLVAGEDPLPLLGGVRWPELIDWPRTVEDARRLNRKLERLRVLINGLHAPLRATLMRLDRTATYAAQGAYRLTPAVSRRFGGCV
jgi:hypothetical protein